MPGQTPTGNVSLLRAYLTSMAGVAVLFSLVALGIWVYTADIVRREGQLISQLLPELDAAYQLTAATAGLQSQGLLLSSSKNVDELERRRGRLNRTIADTKSTIDALLMVELDVRAELEQAVRADVHRHYGPAVASLEEEDVKGLVGRLMGDREYLEKVHGNLLDQKVFGAIHETITIQDEPTTLEAFEKLLAGEAEQAE